MTTERSRVTIDGAAPGLARLLQDAARIAAEHGRGIVTEQDVLAAMLYGAGPVLLEVWWPRKGREPYSTDGPGITSEDFRADTIPLAMPEFRELAQRMVPYAKSMEGTVIPATVTVEQG
ncbi:hypothetical protein [Nocardia sp. NPDC020380]|uniref:hypothetical protein n=1 Tax=Nocardia sp. NPDC020380 TaxID=3364309 RepID=UPI0037B76127